MGKAGNREISLIVIHSADTPNGKPYTVADIDKWHREKGYCRQWKYQQDFNPELGHIGYHYVIYVDGSISSGRSEWEIGAHVKGFNSRSIGICMIGRDKFSLAQWEALQALVTMLEDKYETESIKGHRDFSPDKDGDGVIEPSEWSKTCPGFDVSAWVAGGMKPVKGHIC